MFYQKEYKIIIIGAGHAGTEAAHICAKMGLETLLLTHNIDTIGQMSCNPAIGGIGKGHLVKEIDALGGIMATAIDHAGIQYRTLNSSKGAAVRATRAQADRLLYKDQIRNILQNTKNLDIFQQEASDLIIENNQVVGVKTKIGVNFKTQAVILTTGTFLNGKIHIGLENYNAGRAGDPSSIMLADRLKDLDLGKDRLKTGTPPRLNVKTINLDKLAKQEGDEISPVFSFIGDISQHPKQIPCYITHTNEKTHEIIMNNMDQSPLYSGVIKSIGPRYCPSIEDKVVKFSHRNSHQIYLEPEGLTTNEIYPNGISTSLPFFVQQQIVNSMYGLENTQIIRPGYAIEYDYFDPKGLQQTLETKKIQNLYFAGQINGTTGYEEAAAQGIIAGINAALKIQDKEPLIMERSNSYIGVLIDDLCTLGTKEPYRIFTSRAEYRLILREDNADFRLTPIAHKLGTIDEKRWSRFNHKYDLINQEKNRLKNIWIHPNKENDLNLTKLNQFLKSPLTREINGLDLLKRPEIHYDLLNQIDLFKSEIEDKEVSEQIEISVKYHGYIENQLDEIKKQKKNENTKIPAEFNYDEVIGLSNEVKLKLKSFLPNTVGQASRISGITPAAISIILIYLKKQGFIK